MSNIHILLRSVKTTLRSVRSVEIVKAVVGPLTLLIMCISLIKSTGETVSRRSVLLAKTVNQQSVR